MGACGTASENAGAAMGSPAGGRVDQQAGLAASVRSAEFDGALPGNRRIVSGALFVTAVASAAWHSAA